MLLTLAPFVVRIYAYCVEKSMIEKILAEAELRRASYSSRISTTLNEFASFDIDNAKRRKTNICKVCFCGGCLNL